MSSHMSAPFLAQATGPGGTPIWVILIIVFLILVLFLWGVTSSSGIRGKRQDDGEVPEPALDHPEPESHPEAEEVEETAPIEDAAADNPSP